MRQVRDTKRAGRARRRMPGTVLLAVLLGTAGAGAHASPPPSTQLLPVQVEDGYRAVAQDAADGGATIAVYDRLEPAERKLLQTVKAPAGETFKFFGGLVFKDDDTLFFSENGVGNTAYSASVSTGEAQVLAPKGSLPNVADLAIRRSDGLLFALVTPGPGKGAVYTVSGGQATLF